MSENLTLTTERVDGIPLLLAQLERIGVQALRDEHVLPPTVTGSGNPKRATAYLPAERLLEVFQGLTLTLIRAGRRWRHHLTSLSRVHQRILAPLDFPEDIYMRLCPNSRKPL